MNFRSSVAVTAMPAAHPTAAQDHRFEADPVVSVHENFVTCDVLSQLQRVMENPRFLLAGECVPPRAGDLVRVYASRGPYVCVYPHATIEMQRRNETMVRREISQRGVMKRKWRADQGRNIVAVR